MLRLTFGCCMTRSVSPALLTELPARTPRSPWADVDRRSRLAREIAAGYWRLATDLEGIEALSTQQLALVERAAYLLLRKGTACDIKAWQSAEHGDRTLNRSLRHCIRR